MRPSGQKGPPPKSRVHALPGEWEKVVARGLSLGIFAPIEGEMVFRDKASRPVLNGEMVLYLILYFIPKLIRISQALISFNPSLVNFHQKNLKLLELLNHLFLDLFWKRFTKL